MAYMNMENLVLEDVRIENRWKNFTGMDGKRTFNVILTQEQAEEIQKAGWNVTFKDPEKYNDPFQLKVKVSWKIKPPKICMIDSSKQTFLNEETVSALDNCVIEKAWLVLEPSHWSYQGKEGISAYLSNGRFLVQDDPFEHLFDDRKVVNAPDEVVDPDQLPF